MKRFLILACLMFMVASSTVATPDKDVHKSHGEGSSGLVKVCEN